MTLPQVDLENLADSPTPAQAAQSMPAAKPEPRLRSPQRDQAPKDWPTLDRMLEPDHEVRTVWAAVCKLDLCGWLGEIKAVEGHVGRNATDPRLLLALWVYATVKGIGGESLGCVVSGVAALDVALRRRECQLRHVEPVSLPGW